MNKEEVLKLFSICEKLSPICKELLADSVDLY